MTEPAADMPLGGLGVVQAHAAVLGDADVLDGLLAGEVAQITEIICEQTSLPASGVKIVEKTPG